MTQQYYTISDHLLPLASSFERFQMARFGNVLVLQDGYNPTREEEKEKEWNTERPEKEEVKHGY